MIVTIISTLVFLLIIVVIALELKKSERTIIRLFRRIADLEVGRQEDFVRICELTNELNDAHSNLELVIRSSDKQLDDAHTNIELLIRDRRER